MYTINEFFKIKRDYANVGYMLLQIRLFVICLTADCAVQFLAVCEIGKYFWGVTNYQSRRAHHTP